jgi:hypothetical protein
MKPRQPQKRIEQASISAHRLARFCKLARLWLLRVAGWLIGVAGLSTPLERAVAAAVRPFTTKMTRIVFRLIALKAMASLPPEEKRRGGPPRRARQHYERAVFGARLRRLVKARDPRALIAELLMLLQEADAHAKRLVRRLKNGFTRRRGGFALEPRAARLILLFLGAPLSADTS